VWHLFVIRLTKRPQMMEYLTSKGVGFGIHYPTPIHLHGAFSYLGHRRGDFAVSEHLSETILSLPMYPGMTTGQIDYVIETVKSGF